MKPTIFVAGLGETGSELALRLALDWQVVGIDPDEEAILGLAERQPEGGEIQLHTGDTTSALVLRKADVEGAHAVVACTGSDEVNLEVLRLSRELFKIENLVALMYELDAEEAYRAEGVEIVSQDLACVALLESRVERGERVATGVGLGRGEIVEIEVLPNSSVIGHPLMDLCPRRWLIGAVYRDGKLIVPHGDTVIEAGDRVLIIGDPEILPSVATLIRSGRSEFPVQFGTRVMGLSGRNLEWVVPETGYLIQSTRAENFEVIAAPAHDKRVKRLAEMCKQEGIPFGASRSEDDTVESMVCTAVQRDIGLLVLPPEQPSLLARIGLARTATSRVIDQVSSPVIISRGTFPYRKVMLVLAELPFQARAAQVAIDLVRLLEAELVLGVVYQPDLVAGSQLRTEVEQRRREVESLAGMYHVEMKQVTLEGNPIRQVVEASKDYDLLVLPYRKGRKAFLTRPDVGLNIVHGAHCTVMVMPV